MLNNETFILLILIIVVNTFFIGYLFGKSGSSDGVKNSTIKSFFKDQNTPQNNTISIDSKKFVTDIKTENLEKKYESLGEIKQTNDNISNSVNKLKNLKG